MTLLRRVRRPRGLRVRLVVAFLLVAAFSALLTAALVFRQARSAILDRTQSVAVRDLRAQLDSLAPDLAFPPGASDLRNLTRQLDLAGRARGWRTAAGYAEGPLVPASGDAVPVPQALREEVAAGRQTVTQRTVRGGHTWLTIGMPVTYAPGGGSVDRGGEATGLTVYAVFPLDTEQADIDALVGAARAGAVPALALALVPALYAARRVLLPVRRLRRGAERIASGELGTRLDVTGQDELAALTRTFNTMAAALEQDDAELRRLEAGARRFAADVAHELRTPLAAMTAVTEVLDEDADSGALPEDTADAVRLISDETRKLARMVEDLMEVSRFDAGAAPLQLDVVDLSDLVTRTLRLRGRCDDPRVSVRLPERLPVRVDARRVDVVLGNLVDNALRHGRPPVTVTARAGSGQAVVTVTDSGPGIPADALPHVFDRFYKADRARARSEGSGLGLAIAQENARLHGGALSAANGPGGGAVFTLVLPVDGPAEEET
ncbi:sensor histidine kinase [Streptomyces gamaensis]|uniref:histidine kinase n=1 Tax=Streptomyces gamaensis TaxID=1763542 RepID=A0ABW0YZD4_9ACTN